MMKASPLGPMPAYVFDRMIETDAIIAGFEGQSPVDLVVDTSHSLVFAIRFDIRVDRRPLRGIVRGDAEVLIFNEAKAGRGVSSDEVSTYRGSAGRAIVAGGVFQGVGCCNRRRRGHRRNRASSCHRRSRWRG